MEQPLIDREEVVGMLFGFADLNAKLQRIVELLEEHLDGEEGLPEDDA